MTDINKIRAALNSKPTAPSHLSVSQQAQFELIHSEQIKKTKPKWLKHYTPPHSSQLPHRRKIIMALASNPSDVDAVNIALKILDCKKSNPCRSPFCPYCRSQLQQTAIKNAQKIFAASRNNQLSFLTVLLPVTYEPNNDAAELVKKCRKSIQNIFDRNNFDYIKLYGFCEVDIKVPHLVKNQNRASEVLKPLGFDINLNKPAYLVHLHAIVDLSNSSQNAFRQSLLSAYPHPYQAVIKAFHADKTKDENIRQLANYMLKFLTLYGNNLHADDLDAEIKYTDIFDDALIIDYVKLIHSLLVQNKISSLTISKNC